jgi:hypothetical protein
VRAASDAHVSSIRRHISPSFDPLAVERESESPWGTARRYFDHVVEAPVGANLQRRSSGGNDCCNTSIVDYQLK